MPLQARVFEVGLVEQAPDQLARDRRSPREGSTHQPFLNARPRDAARRASACGDSLSLVRGGLAIGQSNSSAEHNPGGNCCGIDHIGIAGANGTPTPTHKGEGKNHTGKLSCFLPAISTVLPRSIASARAMRGRVARGMITSSI